jgi:hypothetical protein
VSRTTLTLLDDGAPDDDGPPATALAAPADWPLAPEPAAYHGLPGEIVNTLAPHTEADPVAILAQLLVAFGAAVGRGAWFTVEATRHHPNEFLVLVGDSAKARKGSSWDHVARLLVQTDPSLSARTLTGLSSGEGLIWAVRDGAGSDPGAGDQRLLVIEPEFASVLKHTSRDINTLSPVLRSAWDARPLALMTRTAPARATAAHVSVIGHITATELRHHTSTVELANGFLNRFLLIACRRVRLLPEGGQHDPLDDSPLKHRLAQHLAAASCAGQLQLNHDARELWWHAYARLSEPEPEIAGAIGARAEAHTIRLALLYTLIDGATAIAPCHLKAALALHRYSARSARWALDHSADDQLAHEIHGALQHAAPDGLTRTQLRDLYHRNRPVARIDQALAALHAAGKITRQRVLTAGRPAELWTATPAAGHSAQRNP